MLGDSEIADAPLLLSGIAKPGAALGKLRPCRMGAARGRRRRTGARRHRWTCPAARGHQGEAPAGAGRSRSAPWCPGEASEARAVWPRGRRRGTCGMASIEHRLAQPRIVTCTNASLSRWFQIRYHPSLPLVCRRPNAHCDAISGRPHHDPCAIRTKAPAVDKGWHDRCYVAWTKPPTRSCPTPPVSEIQAHDSS